MKNKNIAPKLLMVIGALVYLMGIWHTCPLFSGKGYFLGVLVMGMFAMLAHQRTMQEERRNDDGFVSLCRLVLLLSLGLLMVGARFVPACWDEKSIYVAAWFVCMYGASALPHKALAADVAPQDPTE
ncbi:inner membrane protein YiaB [Klebsiella oxytoca]|uniref:inner membrane protein YiaB n=1 Tax=Klebsiella oxytoca TaxID=571 RepID=UPI0032DA1FF2